MVFGPKEMSPVDTLELISNLEKQINNIVQASNISLVKVKDGLAIALYDQELRQDKIIHKLDEDITNKLVQFQILNVRKHIHRDIFTTYTSNHYIPRTIPPFSETYLVDRDAERRPVPVCKPIATHKAVQRTVKNDVTPPVRARVQTRPVNNEPLNNYEPVIVNPEEPPLSNRTYLNQAAIFTGSKQRLPPPPISQPFAQIYKESNNGSGMGSVGSLSDSPITVSPGTDGNAGFFSSEDEEEVKVNDNTSKTKSAAEPKVEDNKQKEQQTDIPEQKQQYQNLLSYLAPPAAGDAAPFSPYTESMYSEFSAPDSIVDMSKFPNYHSHYSSHYTPSGFHIALNHDDVVSERSVVKDYSSDVETILKPGSIDEPIEELNEESVEKTQSNGSGPTALDAQLGMLPKVLPLVIKEKVVAPEAAVSLEKPAEEPSSSSAIEKVALPAKQDSSLTNQSSPKSSPVTKQELPAFEGSLEAISEVTPGAKDKDQPTSKSPVTTSPSKKNSGKFRWSFGIFSSNNTKKKSKAKQVKHNSVPPVARTASVRRAGSVQRKRAPGSTAGSINRSGSIRSGSIRSTSAVRRSGSIRRTGSVHRSGSVRPNSAASRHRKTSSSPAISSTTSFDFNDTKAVAESSTVTRPNASATRYRRGAAPAAVAATSAVAATAAIGAASRPYRGPVYPTQPQPQPGPEHEYRMYCTRNGTIRKKMSDVSIASKLKDMEINETMHNQGIPPKVPSHSTSLMRSPTSCTSVSEVCITKIEPSNSSVKSAGSGQSNPSTIASDVSVTTSTSWDKAMSGHDTEIYTRKCKFKPQKEQKELSSHRTTLIVEKSSTGDVNSESGSVVLTDMSSSPASGSANLAPKLGNRFMLAGYEDSTRLKVINYNGESAANSGPSSLFEVPSSKSNTGGDCDDMDEIARKAHEHHSQAKLMSPMVPIESETFESNNENPSELPSKKQVSPVKLSKGISGSIKQQRRTSESIARARKYYSWNAPSTNPLPGAQICASSSPLAKVSPTMSSNSNRNSVSSSMEVLPAIPRISPLGFQSNSSEEQRMGSGYFFGLDILGTMDVDRAQGTGNSNGNSTANAAANVNASPTIRVVGGGAGTYDDKDDEEDEYEDIEEEDGDMFASLHKRRSVHFADAADQANLLWANRGASFYGSN